MKKIVCTVTVFCCAVFLMSGTVLAVTGINQNFGSTSQMTVSTSKNVHLEYTVSGTQPQNYGLGAVHSSGNKSYGTSNQTTNIYYKTVTVNTTDPENVNQDELTFSGWVSF